MLIEQDSRCKICSVEFGTDRRTKPHVDHDHSCCPANESCGACIRGILCGDCNKGLGFFRDDPATLEQAIQYLKETPEHDHSEAAPSG